MTLSHFKSGQQQNMNTYIFVSLQSQALTITMILTNCLAWKKKSKSPPTISILTFKSNFTKTSILTIKSKLIRKLRLRPKRQATCMMILYLDLAFN